MRCAATSNRVFPRGLETIEALERKKDEAKRSKERERDGWLVSCRVAFVSFVLYETDDDVLS